MHFINTKTHQWDGAIPVLLPSVSKLLASHNNHWIFGTLGRWVVNVVVELCGSVTAF